MKICSKCKVEKPLTDYYLHNKYMCKVCFKQYDKNRRKGVKLRIPKLTSYAGYDDLNVNINNYESYFEQGFKKRVTDWIYEEIIPELNNKKIKQ